MPSGAEVRPSTTAAAGSAGDLTSREREVLSLASQGLCDQAIASTLVITEQTVTFHLSNIDRELGARNRTAAAAAARRLELIQ